MKKIIITIIGISLLTSCKPTANFHEQSSQTQVVLSNANFKILGSFKGIASEKKRLVKDKEGLISIAKSNLLANAKSSGIELTGSRTLINVSVDTRNSKKWTVVTVSAEIIEFTK